MKVKICGLTRLQDAELALSLGATQLGFIFAPSPRQISLEVARDLRSHLDPKAQVIGVFVNEDIEKIVEISQTSSLFGVQLHGSESASFVAELKQKCPGLFIMKAIGEKDGLFTLDPKDFEACDALLFDSGGSHFSPKLRTPVSSEICTTKPFYLAGSLNSQNVLSMIQKYRPYGIDLSSGVEAAPGIKAPALLKELFLILKDSACIPQ